MIPSTIHIQVTASDWGSVLPELIMGGAMLVMLLLDAFLPDRRKNDITAVVALAAVVLAAVATGHLWANGTQQSFYGTMTSDRFAQYFNLIILISAALAILLSTSYVERSTFDPGEYYALLLGATTGMMLLAAATSLMVIFIAIELLSLSLYILAGMERTRERSQEAGFKYFLLSSFASAFLIYGMALVYGATGSTLLASVPGTRLIGIHECLLGTACTGAALHSPLLYAGIALMVVGFGFKVSLVPFHMWTPDVYEGAPTPITAFMSVTTKAAVFAAFIRVFNLAFDPAWNHWFGLIWALAILTMVFGNLIALVQTNMKRLLAYSGIAHAGYILVALAANNAAGMTAIAFYFLGYAFTNIGAFILVSVLEARGETGDEIATYRGLWYRNPVLAGATAVFMFSLAGFPPTVGFFAKYLAFLAIVRAGHTELAIIGVLTSLISIYYYLRVVVVMFMQPEPVAAKPQELPWGPDVAMAAAVAGTIGLGIIPIGFYSLASQSVSALRAAFGLG